MPVIPQVTLNVGDEVSQFRVLHVTPVEPMFAVVYRLEHIKTGAKVLHIHNEDSENLFSINFLTPPPDDTGLPHIMEHCVLAGSQKFPVREPFFEMIKMSMATFINAMTGSDATFYPVSSNLPRDLFNLAEVYFDAVFHPLLTEQTFRREGHHLLCTPTGELDVNGIVYSEMKGVFSDPQMKLFRVASRNLLPDTVYGRESGGDPAVIPSLTYEQFIAFFREFYHPANARFLFYGNIPTKDYLAFLEPRMEGLEKRPTPGPVVRQPRWSQPRRTRDVYAIGEDEAISEKTYISLDWIVGDSLDPEDTILIRLLALVLLGNDAAPLKKAIIDSKLGADLIASGDNPVGLENTFRLTLKGSESDRAEDFEKLVIDKLRKIASGDISRDAVEAAFQQAAYQYLEIDSMFPLNVAMRVLQCWLYDAEPTTYLRIGEYLQRIRERYERDEKLLQKVITERLIDNPHRLLSVLEPDATSQRAEDAQYADKMTQLKQTLSDDDISRIARETQELDELNSKPNSPESLAMLPQLGVTDLPAAPREIPTSVENIGGAELLINDVFANGVSYLELDFDLRGLPKELWEYLPRYCEAINKGGAAGQSYEQIASRIAGYTGGIGCWPLFMTRATSDTGSVWGMGLRLKTLDTQIKPALDLLHDLLFSVDPRDKNRLRDILLQSRARYRTDMSAQGSRTARTHAGRGLTPEAYLSHLVQGLGQLSLSETLTKQFDETHEDVMARIEAIRDFMLNRARVTASFTGSDSSTQAIRAAFGDWVSQMRDEPVTSADIGFAPYDSPAREGLAGPIRVAHCAAMMAAPHYSQEDEIFLTVGAHMVNLDYILSEIRFKGNAYGAWFSYGGLSRALSIGSYRDPNIAKTLQVIEGVGDFVRNAPWTQVDVDRAIIATAKNDDKPIRPGEATSETLLRHRVGLTSEMRRARYERLRSATPQRVKQALLHVIESSMPHASVCVVAGRDMLEQANRDLKRPLKISNIL